MQEANFSCTFKMYNAQGGVEQFTVRAESIDEFIQNRAAMEQLLNAGYSWQQPKETVKPRTERVSGYVVGETKDRTVCVHLYKRGLKYKAYTLYPEDKHLFPRPWPAKADWPGLPPEQDDAINRGVFRSFEFDLPVAPVLDQDGNPVKNESGFIKYKPDRSYNADSPRATESVKANQPVQAQAGASTVQYIHKRKVPNVGKYNDEQIGSLSAEEPSHNAWWSSLNSAEQDALMYGRSFVASYKKTPASPHGVKVWDSVIAELAAKIGLDKRIVSVYAGYALTDYAQDPDQPPLTGVVQWLAECANKKRANGEANPYYDPEWMEAFSVILRKIYVADTESADDDVPFDFSDSDEESGEIEF